MELFSELYNSYYQITAEILKAAAQSPLTRRQMESIAQTYGSPESVLAIIPKLTGGNWNLLTTADGVHYQSKLCRKPDMPLTRLQQSWLKALLSDDRIRLFFTDEEYERLQAVLEAVPPLFRPSDFLYFDRYTDSDPVTSVMYRQHFQQVLRAIRAARPLKICYYSGKDRTLEHVWLPCRLEYSPRDGKFRLCALYRRPGGRLQIDVLNLARILQIEEAADVSAFPANPRIRQPRSRKPLVLEITDERNALERVLLHFASYEKSVEKLDASDGSASGPPRYCCTIYYDPRWETELLIQVLSFGPMVRVVGPESFLEQIRERVARQQIPQEP